MGVNCPNCQKPLKANAKFCGFCGTHMVPKAPAPKPPPTPKPSVAEPSKPKPPAPEPTPAPAETLSAEPEALFSPYLCAKCRLPLEFVQQYSKWFCSRCKEYDAGSIQYPQQANFNCTVCDSSLGFTNQYNKWFCKTCRNYTLELNNFYLEDDEKVEKSYYNCKYSTWGYTNKLSKVSSWQDVGTVTVTNKSIIFGGSKYWFKTGKIRNVAREYLSTITEVYSYLSQGMKQVYWIRIEYQDPSGFNNVAVLGGSGGNTEHEVQYNTDQLFEYIYNWWQESVKPSERKPAPELELPEEPEPEIPVAAKVETPKAETITEEPAPEPKPDIQSLEGIEVKSAVNYEHAKIIYKVKVENKSVSSISDINIRPYIPTDIFTLDEIEKNIPLIKKGEGKTSTFTIRPKGECGNVEISGEVRYYDNKTEVYNTIKIKARETQIVCPMLKAIPIKEEQWREIISPLISVKETTNDVPLGAEELFDMLADVVKDMNMFMLKPKISSKRFVGRFYSEGIKGFKYAVQVEILGGMQNSKLILNAYAENQECLIGCYHKVLDEIEDRTNIKEYIKDPMIIKGDYIAGGGKVEVKDSVVQRTKIGGGDQDDKDSEVDWE